MGKYDNEMLQQICDNVDLLEYISQTLELKKQGDHYFGHCPQHIDKTPSLAVTPKENFFHCFSCGRSGRIIDYMTEYEGLSFDDAVEKAAKLADIDLSTMCQSQTFSFLKRVRNMMTKPTIPYEHPIIPEAEYEKYSIEPVTEWLNEGIEQSVINRFNIRIDNDCNRIVYPVRDIHGTLINIKARTRYPNYKELRLPKYINYYKVGCMDYFQSLDLTLPFVKEKNEIILFESIKSTMKAYGWGYRNCVSAEKHTLTPEQISLLVKLKVNVVFAYDSDVDYRDQKVKENIDRLKRITNVFLIEDRQKLLGGPDAKNSPADCGRDIWEELYSAKRKVV